MYMCVCVHICVHLHIYKYIFYVYIYICAKISDFLCNLVEKMWLFNTEVRYQEGSGSETIYSGSGSFKKFRIRIRFQIRIHNTGTFLNTVILWIAQRNFDNRQRVLVFNMCSQLSRIDKHWRLIGWGQIRRGIAVKPTEKWWNCCDHPPPHPDSLTSSSWLSDVIILSLWRRYPDSRDHQPASERRQFRVFFSLSWREFGAQLSLYLSAL